jgi:RHS repeat-associated protein
MKTFQKVLLAFGAIIFSTQAHAIMYQMRPYEPNTAHWLTRDPVGEDGGPNLYGFVNNDSVNDVDYLGECLCECVTRVHLTNIRKFSGGGQFGHKYDIVISLETEPSKDGGDYFASLDWSEKVTPTPDWQNKIPGYNPGQWNNMFSLVPTSPTFAPWTGRKVPPPVSSYSVTITDDPKDNMGAPKRTLDLRITVSSPKSSNCNCANASITRTAEQVLYSKPNQIITQAFTY